MSSPAKRPKSLNPNPATNPSSTASRPTIPPTTQPPKRTTKLPTQFVPDGGQSSKNGNRHRKRNLGKLTEVDIEDTKGDRVAIVDEVVKESGSQRLMFKEVMDTATRTGIDKLRLTQQERELALRVHKYHIHAGRFYPNGWYSDKDGLRFFTDFLQFQGWNFIAEFHGTVYPIEVTQFFASVSFQDGVLRAVVNGQAISVTCAEFAKEFQVPIGGLEIVPGADWNGFSKGAKIALKRYFDESADDTSAVLAAPFTPKVKFLLNFLWNTVVPRRGGRDKLASYEIIALKSWLEGEKVNLPLLVFHRIHQMSTIVTDLKFSTTCDIPYGMWVSRMLEVKGVVSADSYGVEPRDRMSDKLLKLMGLEVRGPTLIFREKNSPPAAGVPSASAVSVFAGLESKFVEFMDRVDSRLNEQSSMLAAVGLETSDTTVSLEPRFLDWMSSMDKRLSVQSSVLADVHSELQGHSSVLASIKDTLRMELPFQRKYLGVISGHAKGLYADGGAVIAEVQGIKEVMETVVSQFRQFEGRLQAQSDLVTSCLDRLTSLEFRTRTDYSNPYHTIPPANYDST